jgi:type II secretory pathway pseudopilin PulG
VFPVKMIFQTGMVRLFERGNRVNRLTRLNMVEGFTLLEILLVTVILLVMAGAVLPNFSSVWQRLSLKKSVEEFVYLLRYAQSRAVTTNLRHRMNVVIDGSGMEYWLTQEDYVEEGETEEHWARLEGRYGRTTRLPPGFEVNGSDSPVDFFPDGIISPFELTMCDTRKYCYLLSTTKQRGRVHVFEWKEQ